MGRKKRKSAEKVEYDPMDEVEKLDFTARASRMFFEPLSEYAKIIASSVRICDRGGFQCIRCNRKFFTEALLLSHVEEKHLDGFDGPLFGCKLCIDYPYKSDDIEEMVQHLKHFHEKTLRVDCTGCGQVKIRSTIQGNLEPHWSFAYDMYCDGLKLSSGPPPLDTLPIDRLSSNVDCSHEALQSLNVRTPCRRDIKYLEVMLVNMNNALHFTHNSLETLRLSSKERIQQIFHHADDLETILDESREDRSFHDIELPELITQFHNIKSDLMTLTTLLFKGFMGLHAWQKDISNFFSELRDFYFHMIYTGGDRTNYESLVHRYFYEYYNQIVDEQKEAERKQQEEKKTREAMEASKKDEASAQEAEEEKPEVNSNGTKTSGSAGEQPQNSSFDQLLCLQQTPPDTELNMDERGTQINNNNTLGSPREQTEDTDTAALALQSDRTLSVLKDTLEALKREGYAQSDVTADVSECDTSQASAEASGGSAENMEG